MFYSGTTTTVGYGDLTLVHDSSRVFLIFYIPLSVCVVAGALGKFTSIQFEIAAEKKKMESLNRKLDFGMLREMDKDGGGVDKCEFLAAMLVQNDICDYNNDIKPWLKRFDELDVDGSGTLDEEDIKMMEEQENERLRKLQDATLARRRSSVGRLGSFSMPKKTGRRNPTKNPLNSPLHMEEGSELA